jgi:hypothetical protein
MTLPNREAIPFVVVGRALVGLSVDLQHRQAPALTQLSLSSTPRVRRISSGAKKPGGTWSGTVYPPVPVAALGANDSPRPFKPDGPLGSTNVCAVTPPESRKRYAFRHTRRPSSREIGAGSLKRRRRLASARLGCNTSRRWRPALTCRGRGG